jgi:hypothetical protein
MEEEAVARKAQSSHGLGILPVPRSAIDIVVDRVQFDHVRGSAWEAWWRYRTPGRAPGLGPAAAGSRTMQGGPEFILLGATLASTGVQNHGMHAELH